MSVWVASEQRVCGSDWAHPGGLSDEVVLLINVGDQVVLKSVWVASEERVCGIDWAHPGGLSDQVVLLTSVWVASEERVFGSDWAHPGGRTSSYIVFSDRSACHCFLCLLYALR